MAQPGNPTYLPASFKGVPFDCVASQDEFGRRGDQYEYPLAEHTSYKDLGRKIRRYKLEGRITGPDHAAVTAALVAVCESPGPGMLMHPAHGPVMVACVSLSTGFEYHDKKRYTKLDFDFVEANDSLAPFALPGALGSVLRIVQTAVAVAIASGRPNWSNTLPVSLASRRISTRLAALVKPIPRPDDEASYDTVDRLNRGVRNLAVYDDFDLTCEPITEGTATVRVLHLDAMTRLRDFNTTVVATVNETPAVEPLGVVSRLSTAGDMALIGSQFDYPTVTAAIQDLDRIMAIYDEEQAIASQKGDDVLSMTIGQARATAASAILAGNISLPGITTFDAKGVWPSLVSAHLVYGDGRRFADLEAYNPTYPTFAMGRELVGPAR